MNSNFKFVIGSAIALAFLAAAPAARANPEIGAAIAREFGEASARNILLVRAGANESDPAQWTVYSRDPHQPGHLVRSIVTKVGSNWTAAPAGAERTLKRAPSHVLDIKKVGWNSQHARETASKAAALANVTFAKVDYQLAADEDTGAPEWGLALLDATGYEVGFCVISAETGVVKSQDWTPKVTSREPRPPTPESAGERAAKKVKAEVRKAWRWGENAGRRAGGFFRELFRRD